MPNLGVAEILVILVVALIVFGPNRLPDLSRQVGKAFREVRQMQEHLRGELHEVLGEFDPTRPLDAATASSEEADLDHDQVGPHAVPPPDADPLAPGASPSPTTAGAHMPTRFRAPSSDDR